MSKKTYYKQKKIPLYGGYLTIIISSSKKKVGKLLDEDIDEDLYAHAYDWQNGHYAIVLNIEDIKKKNLKGTVAHEAVHTAHGILERAGVVASHINDEAMAYLVTWLVNQIHKVIDKC